MNRVDELTLKLLDGTLTGEERMELERLVRDDAGAARAHAEMLDLVAAIRGEGPMADVAGRTLDRIHERITEKIEVGVMHQIRQRGKERASARRIVVPRRRNPVWMIGVAAAVVIVAVAVALMIPSPRPPEGEARVAPSRKIEPPVPPPPAPEPPVREAPPPPKVETPVPPPPIPEPVRKVDKPAPVPPPVVEKKPEPKPEPVPEPPKPVVPLETIVVVATIEKAESATVLGKGGKAAAKAGQDLLQGQGLDAEGPVSLKYPDGTRVELRPKTLVREFTLNGGKGIDLARGVLLAQVSDQPADRPMTVVTPLAEVRILGTAFKVSVDPETEGTTQVEVTEGKVRVKRLADGKTVDVARGGVVSVGKGTEALAAHLSAGLVA
ncbi:MAG TPA: FecR family protein, partial [Planctomycetota bacterium]|nr:FecR family protein [Planctomycetota bacterium]